VGKGEGRLDLDICPAGALEFLATPLFRTLNSPISGVLTDRYIG